MILEVPGIAHTAAYTGRSGSTFSHATNVGAIFAVIDDPRKRLKKGLTIEKISELVTARMNELEESKTFVFIPPPVRGMGGQTGFSMRLQNRANMTPAQFEKVASSRLRTGHPASPTSSRLSRPARRRSTSTSTATRRRC